METCDDGKYRFVSIQRCIYPALANSTRIYDDPPQAASHPFISLGQSRLRDWSTGTEDGAEHLLTCMCGPVPAARSRYTTLMNSRLNEQPLALADYERLRHEFSEARPDPGGDTYHGIMR
jgi:hypothetical protein